MPIEYRETLKKERWRALFDVWPLLLLILGITGGLYGGVFTPTKVGACGALMALVIGWLQGRMNLERLIAALKESMSTTAQIFFVGMGAVMYTKFLALAGTSAMLTQMVGSWTLEPIYLVLALSIVYLILGIFLDPLGVLLITISVFILMFKALGLDLIWLGVLVVKYIEIGLLTPPVGFNVYVVNGVVGDEIPLHTTFHGCFSFLVCEIFIMALLIGFPQISLFLPNSMY